MLNVHVIIKGQVWQVHINEDSSKLGCDLLKREIWVNGETDLVESNLYRFMQVAVDYEYANNEQPSEGEVEYLCNKLLMAYRLRI